VSLRARFAAVRSEEGFGLVELLIALTILAIGIGATLAVFTSSIVALRHTSRAGTALTIAERQLEAYRAMPFACVPRGGSIAMPGTCTTAPTYSGFPNPYAASQAVSGADAPDNRSYAVTTAVSSSPTNPQITVTVAQSGAPATVLATESSYFSDAGTAPTTG
jgi:prepilin-type N-terminal cleavage/methylation domain-containing protein